MARAVSYMVLGVATALLASGCGDVRTAGSGQPAAVSSAPLDAALVTPDFGWVLTEDRVLLTHDGGATFQASKPSVMASTTRVAFFHDAARGWVAGLDRGSIAIARTTDGGRTWQTSTVRSAAPLGSLRVAFADARRGLLLAKVATGVNFSVAEAYVTSDGGRTWSSRKAPVAGDISMERGGRMWLAGGVRDDEVYTSTDQARSWSRTPLRFTAPAESAAAAAPSAGLLPVTLVRNGRTEVALMDYDRGAWREANSTVLATRAGSGVRAPLSVTSGGTVLVEPKGGAVHRTAQARSATKERADGLVAGVTRVVFTDDAVHGWALAISGRCVGGKQQCSQSRTLLATDDGGRTWRHLLRWTGLDR